MIYFGIWAVTLPVSLSVPQRDGKRSGEEQETLMIFCGPNEVADALLCLEPVEVTPVSFGCLGRDSSRFPLSMMFSPGAAPKGVCVPSTTVVITTSYNIIEMEHCKMNNWLSLKSLERRRERGVPCQRANRWRSCIRQISVTSMAKHKGLDQRWEKKIARTSFNLGFHRLLQTLS